MMKRFNLLFLAFIFIIALSTTRVEAYTPSIVKGFNCLENNTCILVCNYYNLYDNFQRNISLYYHLDTNLWTLTWDREYYNDELGHESKGPLLLSTVFSKSGGRDIYVQSTPNSDHFNCFNYAYIDYDGFNSLCLDDDGNTCRAQYGNWARDYKPVNELEKAPGAGLKDYDYKTVLENFYNNALIASVSCSDISSGNVNLTDQNFLSQRVNDFLEQNFSNGYGVPIFVTNAVEELNSKYQNESSENSFAKEVEDKMAQCSAENAQASENGQITYEEYQQRQEVINSIDTERVVNALVSATTQVVNSNTVSSDNWNKVEVQCDDIFKLNEEGSVGWILNTIFNYIKVIGPILVVLLSAIDFIKAVVGSDEKAMKKAQSKLIIRLIAAVALFLIPTLVQLLLQFINVSLDPECFLQ